MGHAGNVGGYTKIVRVDPTITAGAYSANDVVGGELAIPNAMRVPNGTGVLQSITVYDADNEKAALDFYFFQSAPAAALADNAAFAWTAGDEDLFLGMVSVAAADYVTATDAVVSVRNIGLPVRAAANGNSLYCYVVATGTPTYTAATDLTFIFGFLQD